MVIIKRDSQFIKINFTNGEIVKGGYILGKDCDLEFIYNLLENIDEMQSEYDEFFKELNLIRND